MFSNRADIQTKPEESESLTLIQEIIPQINGFQAPKYNSLGCIYTSFSELYRNDILRSRCVDKEFQFELLRLKVKIDRALEYLYPGFTTGKPRGKRMNFRDPPILNLTHDDREIMIDLKILECYRLEDVECNQWKEYRMSRLKR